MSDILSADTTKLQRKLKRSYLTNLQEPKYLYILHIFNRIVSLSSKNTCGVPLSNGPHVQTTCSKYCSCFHSFIHSYFSGPFYIRLGFDLYRWSVRHSETYSFPKISFCYNF